MRWDEIVSFLVLPVVLGAGLGYATNWLAVKMLLRPVRPVNVLGFRIQGLLPRRQAELADRISAAIAREFLTEADIMNFLKKADPSQALKSLFARKWEEKVGDILAAMPFLAAFLSPEKLGFIRDAIADAIAEESEPLLEALAHTLEDKIDLQETLRVKILGFDLQRLNAIIEEIGQREFREITWLGGIIGVVIGAVQAGLNLWYRLQITP